MSIITVDNFDSSFFKLDDIKNGFSFNNTVGSNYFFKSTSKNIDNININLEHYKENQNDFFIFSDDSSKDDDLIISISSYSNSQKEKKYTVSTGNYIGEFYYKKIGKINIKSRFPDIFLKRMLNFANDIFLDEVSVFDAKEENKNNFDYSKLVIYYMFIQKLEKAFLLGIPKSYVSVEHHEMKVKGKININRFIKYDIPFKGKISSISREQQEIQEIIDVLYKAIYIIEINNFNTRNIIHIKTHLKQARSNKFVSDKTIAKAIKSKALQNPIFSSYRKVLDYAKLIIDANNLEKEKNANKETFGFLLNIAELFEIYLFKLLKKEFPDWKVEHEPDNIELYPNNFFQRKIKPDIVMSKDKYVMVFDAKYKQMLFRGRKENIWDVDRNDFFQIHTYMSYYKNQGNTVIAGGLLYPMESDIVEIEKTPDRKAYANNWLGDTETKFIVDGIDLSNIEKDTNGLDDEGKAKKMIENIKESEKNFINKLRQLGGNQYE